MTTTLYIAEYNNMGDLSLETPMEPPARVQKVSCGGVSEPIDANTRLVTLFATAPCWFGFFDDHDWNEGDEIPAAVLFVPIAANTETIRVVHAGTTLRVAVMGEG